jgi:hypothetical protein
MPEDVSSTAKASKSVREKNGRVPQCKTCRFPNHEKYDADCIQGKISKLEYAKLVGCSDKSISRHLAHIPQILVNSANAEVVSSADNLFEQIGYYETEARRYKELAEAEGDLELALKAIDRALKCVDIYARVRGLIQEQQINVSLQQSINIYESPEWLAVGDLLARILGPYPDLRQRVAAEFLALERRSCSQ